MTERADWPAGYDLILMDSVDSTMAEAARRAASIRVPTWIVAREQTAGRGRRGRAWADPVGNFAGTLIYRPDTTAQQAALRSFVAANALFDALALWTGQGALATKWPNDVLLNGGKVAGILLESAGTAGGLDWLSIGIGVNLAHHPEGVDNPFPPVSVAGVTGQAPAIEDFATALATAFAQHENSFTALGFEPERGYWLQNAAKRGEVITARTAQDVISGIFEGIDSDGNLILQTGAGVRLIAAADVHF